MAKGTITTWSCDPSTNGLSTAKDETDYILGAGGQPVTELAQNADGSMNWQRTYVYAGAALIATYNPSPNPANQPLPSFRLTDWLGTMRASTDSSGVLQGTCAGLPYGDSVPCQGNIPDPHYFTGKERDTESGNDYFGARYYSSALARWLSPDWSAKAEPVPYAKLDDPQSLNLYAYVGNNPLSAVDPDGHEGAGGKVKKGSQPSSNGTASTEQPVTPSSSGGNYHPRRTSEKGRKFLELLETNDGTPNLSVYADSAVPPNPTIGYGHMLTKTEIRDCTFAKGIAAPEADRIFAKEIKTFERDVNHHLNGGGGAVSQDQFDALVCVSFNSQRAAHVLMQQINAGHTLGTFDFVESLKYGWNDQKGLVFRRMNEAGLYGAGLHAKFANGTGFDAKKFVESGGH